MNAFALWEPSKTPSDGRLRRLGWLTLLLASHTECTDPARNSSRHFLGGAPSNEMLVVGELRAGGGMYPAAFASGEENFLLVPIGPTLTDPISSTLKVLNVSVPSQPTETAILTHDALKGATDVAVSADWTLAFIASWYFEGLAVVNLRFPTAPHVVGSVQTPGGVMKGACAVEVSPLGLQLLPAD